MQNWKTTVAGAGAAGLYAWANAANMDTKHALLAAAIAIFGYLAKDA